jgi:hypothetical protein
MKTQKKAFMARAFISLFLCVFIVFWGFQVLAQDWTPEQKEVWVSVQEYWENIKKGDVEAALAGQHDKMLAWFSMNPDPLKKEGIRSQYSRWVSRFKPTFVKLEPLAINIVKNVANVFYLFKWESANKEVSARGRILITLVKQDNKWLAIGSLYSSCDKLSPCPYGW